MEKTKTSKGQGLRDVQTIINEAIIEHLELGTVPWRTPWTEPGIPTNLISKKPYRGINVILLAALGYKHNFFITENQLEEIGGSIKPNEKKHKVVFWKPAQGDGGSAKLEYRLVYNIAQCAGILGDLVPDTVRETDPIAACERIISGIQQIPEIRHKEPGSFYDPCEDYINIPKLKTFENPACYYSQLFHQMAHSTGHHSRLDRMGLVQMSEYGCMGFTLEELVAEIATNHLENLAGIPCPFEPSQEYVNGWLQKLRGDRYLIFNACSQAQKAVDFILNVKETKEEAE